MKITYPIILLGILSLILFTSFSFHSLSKEKTHRTGLSYTGEDVQIEHLLQLLSGLQVNEDFRNFVERKLKRSIAPHQKFSFEEYMEVEIGEGKTLHNLLRATADTLGYRGNSAFCEGLYQELSQYTWRLFLPRNQQLATWYFDRPMGSVGLLNPGENLAGDKWVFFLDNIKVQVKDINPRFREFFILEKSMPSGLTYLHTPESNPDLPR